MYEPENEHNMKLKYTDSWEKKQLLLYFQEIRGLTSVRSTLLLMTAVNAQPHKY